MSATVISVFILAMSGALLVFWLRSVVQSILRERFEQSYSAEVAEANRLEFLHIRKALQEQAGEVADYRGALDALERDFEALNYLLRNAATVHVGRITPSERLLATDFHLMRLWARVSRALGLRGWRSSLVEMTSILEYFGNVVGQRLATFPSRIGPQ